MNGATALDCENTINRPNRTNTTTIGTSQYFFSARRNSTNSDRTCPLLMVPSKHPIEVAWIAIALRRRNPSGPGAPSPCERILAGEPPDQADGGQQHEEQYRQEHT